MATDPKSRPDLLGFLQEQIKRRESFRQEIDRSIDVLREAEKELRRILPGADAPGEAPDDLPYRIQPAEAAPARREPPRPQARWEEPADAGGLASPLERPLSSFGAFQPPREIPAPAERLSAEGAPIPQPLDLPRPPDAPARRGAFARGTRGVDETLQDEQMLLLGVDDVTSSRRKAEAPPRESGGARQPAFHEEEAPPNPPAPARPASAREEAGARAQAPKPPAPIGPSVQKLMDYIRLGGAVRCLDPWNRTCAAFVFRSNGSAIFATDVFVNYLRAVFSRVKTERPGDSASGLLREAVPQIRFLSALVEALQTQRLLSVRAVKGLQLSGGQKLPPGFEFEASTRDMMHPLLLERLLAVLRKPPLSFFLPDGPYAEVRSYLAGYQAFCRTNGEESRAAAMLVQIGLEEAPPGGPSTPGGKTAADVPPPPEDTRIFMEEAEGLQDLNTFDFSPEDQKSILAHQEDAFSMSSFRRPPGRPGKEEASTPIPGPAANGESARKDDEIKKFLKGLGIEWKG